MGDYRKWETMGMRGPQGVGTMRSERPVGMGGHRDQGVIGSGIPVGSGGGLLGVRDYRGCLQELTSRQRTENTSDGHMHPHTLAQTFSWVYPGE